mmetsp:Transcript_29055/g.56915  ORF Transcript_29055/g.56915 Transcript_29055/m.56915 type:complete len:97 (-) Transcript_29055:1098-1388(-)
MRQTAETSLLYAHWSVDRKKKRGSAGMQKGAYARVSFVNKKRERRKSASQFDLPKRKKKSRLNGWWDGVEIILFPRFPCSALSEKVKFKSTHQPES